MSEIKDVLQEIGYSNITDGGKYYRMRPIYRDSTNNSSLSAHKETGNFRDFSSNQRGSFNDLVKLTLNLKSPEDAKRWVRNKGVSITEAKSDKPEIKHPKTYSRDFLDKLPPDHSYWVDRGIDLNVIQEFQGGTCDSGKMKGRYVFPIFNSLQEIIGFSGRDILPNNPNSDFVRPKWKHIGDKSKWKYPIHLNLKILQERKRVILVESVGDMLALWNAGIKNTIITFGVDVSTEILNCLLKLDMDKITISLNNDYDNNNVGNKAAQKIKNKLLKYFDAHQVKIMLPTKNDFGDMTKSEITDWAYGKKG